MPPENSNPPSASLVRISFGPQGDPQVAPVAFKWESEKVKLDYYQENIPLLSKAYRDYLRAVESPRACRLTLDFAHVFVRRSNCSFCLGMLHGTLDVVEDHCSDADTMELILTVPPDPLKPKDPFEFVTGWTDRVIEHLPYISSLWLQLPAKTHPGKLYHRLISRDAQRLTRIVLDVPEGPNANTNHQLPPTVVSQDGEVDIAPLLRCVVLNGPILPPLCTASEYAHRWKYPGVKDFTYRIAYYDQVLNPGLRTILALVFPALESIQIVLEPQDWYKVKMSSGNKRRPIAPNVFVPGRITPGTKVRDSVWDPDPDIVPKQGPPALGKLPLLSSLSIYIPCGAAPEVAPDWVVAVLISSDRPLNIKYYEYYF